MDQPPKEPQNAVASRMKGAADLRAHHSIGTMALTLAAASFAFQQAPMLARPMASSVVMSAANGMYVAKVSIASRIARRFPGG